MKSRSFQAAGHSRHEVCVLRSVVKESSHRKHSNIPTPDMLDPIHGMHGSTPVLGWNLPGLHAWHEKMESRDCVRSEPPTHTHEALLLAPHTSYESHSQTKSTPKNTSTGVFILSLPLYNTLIYIYKTPIVKFHNYRATSHQAW